MRPTGNTLSNKTKRDDSVELSRFSYEKISHAVPLANLKRFEIVWLEYRFEL